MDLIERAGPLTLLQSRFDAIAEGEGHCVLVSGEAGIGKTALIRAFCQQRQAVANIYLGTCDALFTPRPLAPLYDIIWQIWGDEWKKETVLEDRVTLFTQFFHRLAGIGGADPDRRRGTTILVFEDIHWADEATLDFIKFLARRITRIRCLFILTYRDDEVHALYPLRDLLGQLPAHSFTRLQPARLSHEAVDRLAAEKGYNGQDVYSISGGNPFYVYEILASYSPGIPENIKDSILSVYHRLDEKTKKLWEILSVQPTGFEMDYLGQLEPQYGASLAPCLEAKILVLKENKLFFKHELYRRTVETALSPFLRIELHKMILQRFIGQFEREGAIYRIIHHAKNANEHELVVRFAPIAARQAAALGAHVEASKLYLSAIEYYQEEDKDGLAGFYAAFAYECYLTGRIQDAIVYQTRASTIWKEKGDIEKRGHTLWFLSRLWWFDGNRRQAETHAQQAIELLADRPSSSAKAMAFSNMSQLKMLSDKAVECIFWGDKAIVIAKELDDQESLCHALNNVGTVHMRIRGNKQKGIDLLMQSLNIALANGFQEHAARAYTNLVSDGVRIKDYPFAAKILGEGLRYCEERELDTWQTYMLSWKARLLLDTGRWDDAALIAGGLIGKADRASIVKVGALVVAGTIQMRRGEPDALGLLLEARTRAFDSMELQRILPALAALLEYEWITGENHVEKAAVELAIGLIGQPGYLRESSEFEFWLNKVRHQQLPLHETEKDYRASNPAMALEAAAGWQRLGCPYEQALLLFEGDEQAKKEAISLVHQLGAIAVYEKMKEAMRSSGITGIPRGMRKTTQANPAQLTERELGVLQLLKEGLQNKEIGSRLFISAKTVDHHISSILFKLDVNSRTKAVQEATRLGIVK
jgi:DNA-binding CsgD family transcriptional regulator